VGSESPGEAVIMHEPTDIFSDSPPVGDGPAPSALALSQLVQCAVDKLQLHPAFELYKLVASVDEIAYLERQKHGFLQEPLLITQDFLIVAGHTRWLYARQNRHVTIPCLQRQMTEEEAVLALLENNRRGIGLNDYIRILIALGLEPWFKEKACANQSSGGRLKGSSNLTEADRIDVRSEIAIAAGVCVANVSKVRYIQVNAAPQLHNALLKGELRINRAHLWSKEPAHVQIAKLRDFRVARGMRRDITMLISKNRSKASRTGEGLKHLSKAIAIFEGEPHSPISVEVLEMLRGNLKRQSGSGDEYVNAA
jgi:hypothetical protein